MGRTTLALAATLFASTLAAGEIESGIPVGQKVGAYSTVKVCGIADGFTNGCYT